MSAPKYAAIQKKILLLLTIVFLLCQTAAAETVTLKNVVVRSAPLVRDESPINGMVRVYLSSLGNPSTLNLTLNGRYSLSSNGQFFSYGTQATVSFNASSGAITLQAGDQTFRMGKSFSLRRHSTTGENGILIRQARDSNHPYPGDLSFQAVTSGSGYKLYVIAHVYIEEYLYGVLPYEMGNSSNVEALKAQAVAARTYTVRMMQSRASGIYDVQDTTNDQTYRGTPSGNANCRTAVDETKGVVLAYNGSYITTYYSASNGGQTETVRGGGSYPYLPVKDDPFDLANPSSLVKSKTVQANLQSSSNPPALTSLLLSRAVSRLKQQGYPATSSNTTLKTLQKVELHSPKYASPSKLYTKADFTLTAQTRTSSGSSTTATVTVTCGIFDELESLLSMGIQSSANELWSIKKEANAFVLQARRYGHGMGMSQRGAVYMGQMGYTYDQILGFYYENCVRLKRSFIHTILSGSGSDEESTVVPPTDNEVDDAACTGVVNIPADRMLAVRRSKSANGALAGAIPGKAMVKIDAIDGNWCFITYGDIRGYVQKSSLSVKGTPDGAAGTPSSVQGFATVTAKDYVNLRAGQSTGSAILGTAPGGAVLNVFSTSGSWARVQYNALTAYVSTSFISSVTQEIPFFNEDDGTGDDETDDVPDVPETEIEPEDELTAIVNTQSGSLNMRAEASTGSRVIATIPKGTKIVVLNRGESWCRVQYAGYTGYVMTRYLSFDDPAEEDEPSKPYARVTTASGSLNLRASASAQAAVISTIPRNATVKVLSYGTQWCRIAYREHTGYAMTRYLTLTDDPGTEEPSEEVYASENAWVNTVSGSLNLRQQPSANAAVIGSIPKGAKVEVLDRKIEWCRVRYAGRDGYVMTKFLTFEKKPSPAGLTEVIVPLDEEEPQDDAFTSPQEQIDPTMKAPDEPTFAVPGEEDGADLWTGCKEDGDPLAKVATGEEVEIILQGETWCLVQYQDLQGYCLTNLLKVLESETE